MLKNLKSLVEDEENLNTIKELKAAFDMFAHALDHNPLENASGENAKSFVQVRGYSI